MEVVNSNYMPGDPRLIQQLVYELKSQGIFDQFRKECIADVDTKPAYQNLRQRVEGSVTSFLKQQTWRPDMNKNQVREQLRKNIYESGYLETGVERIVDQVVNPKINTVFLPQVEDVVYRYLGIEKPYRVEVKKELKIDVTDLLPTDLEAVSPESDHTDRKDEDSNLNDSLNMDSKLEEDESPPFEPIEMEQNFVQHEENSVDSHLSGFSGLQSHDSNPCNDTKMMDLSNQDSQVSQNSSESHLSIITSEENTKMEVCEDSESKLKSSDSESKTEVIINSACAKTEQNSAQRERPEIEEMKKQSKKDDRKTDQKKHENRKSEKRSDDKRVDEKKYDDRKYEKKNDDKKSRSSDKYSSKDKKDDKKDDKHRKSSSNSSSGSKDKDKSSSKHSSTSSSKDKDKIKDKKDAKISTSSSKERDKYEDKREKEKPEKERSDKEKSDKDREKNEKERTKSSTSSSSRHSSSTSNSNNKDKEKSSHSRKESSSKDKEKSRSSSTSASRDNKSKSSHSDSKSKSSSDKHKKNDKSSHSSRASSSSSSTKKDRDKKRESKKESKDDHYSAKDKQNHRRSTDRDSNDGQSSRHGQSNSLTGSNSSHPQRNKQESSNLNRGSGSGDSGNSDKIDQSSIRSVTKISERIENREVVIPCSDPQKFKYTKPKFASNFEEARKLMKIRKQLALLEKQNQLSLAQIEVPVEQLPNINGISCTVPDKKVEIGKTDESITEPKTPERKEEINSPKALTPVLQSTDLSKESWEALEARLAQEMSNVNYNSYESPYDDYDYTGYNSITISPRKQITDDNCTGKNEQLAKVTPKIDTEEKPVEKLEHSTQNEVKEELSSPAQVDVDMGDVVTEQSVNLKLKTDEVAATKEKTINSEVGKLILEEKRVEEELDENQETCASIILSKKAEQPVNESTEDKPDQRITRNLQIILRTERLMSSTCDGDDQCRYLEQPSPSIEKRLQFIQRFVETLEKTIERSKKSPRNNCLSLKKGRKRKLEENVDLKNNNKSHYEQTAETKKRRQSIAPDPNSVISKPNKEKICNSTDISPNDSFSLPLSPAESDKSNDKKEDESPKPAKQKRNMISKPTTPRSQRYSSDDLYKPRPMIASTRRSRSAKNPEC